MRKSRILPAGDGDCCGNVELARIVAHHVFFLYIVCS
uniref:Uncharacterized protein n=1 Tax=Oryza meridionalis TaxID=40149 RepID=A0A0E0D529_9ORYZ